MAEAPLIVRLPNALGDLVMVQPALAHLAAAGHSLLTIGPPIAAELHHDQLWRSAPLPSSIDDFRALRESGTRYAVLLRSSFRSSRELRAVGLRTIGFRADLRSLLLWRAIKRPRGRHKVEEYFHLARCAAAAVSGVDLSRDSLASATAAVPPPRLRANDAARAHARRRLEACGAADFVVCCPTVAPHHPPRYKAWPGFPELYRRLAERGVPAVTCPGPREEERALEAGAGLGLLLPDLDVPTVAAVLGAARAVVSNDTGPMHLAAALGTPTLGLFGDTTPARYAPYGPAGTALGEPGRWPSPDEVWRWLERTLAGNEARRDSLL